LEKVIENLKAENDRIQKEKEDIKQEIGAEFLKKIKGKLS